MNTQRQQAKERRNLGTGSRKIDECQETLSPTGLCRVRLENSFPFPGCSSEGVKKSSEGVELRICGTYPC